MPAALVYDIFKTMPPNIQVCLFSATMAPEILDLIVSRCSTWRPFSTGIRTIYSDICKSGAKTLSTGTGSVTLNGDVAIARDKDFA